LYSSVRSVFSANVKAKINFIIVKDDNGYRLEKCEPEKALVLGTSMIYNKKLYKLRVTLRGYVAKNKKVIVSVFGGESIIEIIRSGISIADIESLLTEKIKGLKKW